MRNSKTNPLRILANRANCQRSTGPRSHQGKTAASQNAVTTGFYGGDIVLKPFDPAGTPEQFAALRQSLFDDLTPEGQLESVIVDRIAAILWRQRRAYRLEGQAVLAPDYTLNPIRDALHAALKQASKAPPALFPSQQDFDKFLRYESLIDRQLHRALLQLSRLRRGALTPITSADASQRESDASSPTDSGPAP